MVVYILIPKDILFLLAQLNIYRKKAFILISVGVINTISSAKIPPQHFLLLLLTLYLSQLF